MNFNILRSQLPTIQWRIDMEENIKDAECDIDEIKMNDEILKKVDSFLLNFISNMESLDSRFITEDSIKNEVKKVVLNLNDFDSTRNIILTGGREDLCIFIDQVISATGFIIPDDEDYTLEWREW